MSVLFLLSAAAAFAVNAAPKSPPATIYDFTMNNIDEKPVALDKFKGKVLLVVNVASYCGNTPQYKGLEAMYTQYKDKGFAVLGFPANEFGQQEPDGNAKIKEFCQKTYDVKFPMFSKIVVKGDGIHPLYQWLITNSGSSEDIHWNFEKFLIGRDGKVAGRFSPKMKPDNPDLVKAVEAELAKS
jgi:glutathione peroxidase